MRVENIQLSAHDWDYLMEHGQVSRDVDSDLMVWIIAPDDLKDVLARERLERIQLSDSEVVAHWRGMYDALLTSWSELKADKDRILSSWASEREQSKVIEVAPAEAPRA